MLVVSGSILSVELFVRHNIPNIYKTKNDWLSRNSSSVELLVLGNSHCYYGIRPERLSCKSYNVAIVSQTLEYDFFILQKYDFTSLRDVIINVDVSNVFDPLLPDGEKFRCAYYAIYMDCPARLTDLSSRFEVMNPGALRQKILGFAKNGSECLNCSALGYGLDHVHANRSESALSDENAAKRAKALITSRWKENFDRNIVSLMQIADFCKERDIRLTVISTPLHHLLRQHIPQVVSELTGETLKELSQNGNFRYLDFSDDSGFSEDAFFDEDHLSDVGAVLLTEKISGIINYNSTCR